MRQEEVVFIHTLIRGAMSGRDAERQEMTALANVVGYGKTKGKLKPTRELKVTLSSSKTLLISAWQVRDMFALMHVQETLFLSVFGSSTLIKLKARRARGTRKWAKNG